MSVSVSVCVEENRQWDFMSKEANSVVDRQVWLASDTSEDFYKSLKFGEMKTKKTFSN